MKKKALSKKLNLNKSIVSKIQAKQVKGGGTEDCVVADTRTCIPPPSQAECIPFWTTIKTRG